MPEIGVRIGVGVALALLVTVLLAALVVTSAAFTIELSDGDRCETGGNAGIGPTVTPQTVTALAGNVTECIATDDDPGQGERALPSRHR